MKYKARFAKKYEETFTADNYADAYNEAQDKADDDGSLLLEVYPVL